MDVRLHQDAGRFADLVRPWFAADPVRHTVALTVLDRLLAGADTADVMVTEHADGRLLGAALRTTCRGLLASGLYLPGLPAVIDALVEADPVLPAVLGPEDEAGAFAAGWAARTGARVAARRSSRLFRLGELIRPRAVPGAARLAGPGDVELLGAWRWEFAIEAGEPPPEPSGQEQARHALRLGRGELLWEVDGRPVAHASASRPQAGMSRIGPVYTPAEFRGHGYASAATAAASQWARDAGADDVLLFTDLANETANRIYPRLGYRPVHDEVEIALTV